MQLGTEKIGRDRLTVRSLPKPTTSSQDAYAKSIEFAEGDFATRLANQSALITQAADTFDAAATAGAVHTIQIGRDLAETTNAEMKSVYQKGFSAGKAPARPIYNALRKNARNNKCPLCGVNQVTTLDHHLPQSRYAALVVCPNNLVPACSDCNRWKLANIPIDAGSQTFHPYYDNPNVYRWLKATCIEGDLPALEFDVKRPAEWNDIDEGRANRHLKIFKLRALYASNSADELINLKGNLLRVHDDGGAQAIREHLEEQESTYLRAHVNSWQAAMYGGLLDSDWFVQTGFLSIPD